MREAPRTTAHRPPPIGACRPVPTTATERWEEIVEASHDGLALIDNEGRFGYVSSIFASLLGIDIDLLRQIALVDMFPGLERRPNFAGALAAGKPVRLELERHRVAGTPKWLRMTLVPRPADGPTDRGMIALIQDVSGLRHAQLAHRKAQQRLTEIEEELRTRAERDIHDGPVQLLAVLTLRLNTAIESGLDPKVAEPLKRSIEVATAELRDLIRELTTADSATVGDQLLRWAEPVLARTTLDLEVVDRIVDVPDRSVVEALFVLLHEAILSAADDPAPRTLRTTIATRTNGVSMTIEIPFGTEGRAVDSSVMAHIAAGRVFAHSLNGAVEVEWADPALPRHSRFHIVRAWLPTWAPAPVAVAVEPPTVRRPSETVSDDRAVSSVPLDDRDWEALADACHEGLVEIDGDMVVTSINGAYSAAMRRPVDELIGRPFEQIFQPSDYERLLPYVERVQAGEAIRFDWQRRNAAGDARWTQVSASPRCDAEGRFAGALVVTLDTSEFHHVLDLIQTVRDQIEQARAGIARSIAAHLHDGPLQRLQEVGDCLEQLGGAAGSTIPVEAIRRELETSISRVRASLGDVAEPDIADGDWVRALGDLVAPLVVSSPTMLVVDSEVEGPLAAPLAETVVRVAREAITNAVLHGRARRIEVELTADEAGSMLRVADDGVGIDADELVPRAGHLGIRSMLARVAERHGTLTIQPGPAGGTQVIARFPNRLAD